LRGEHAALRDPSAAARAQAAARFSEILARLWPAVEDAGLSGVLEWFGYLDGAVALASESPEAGEALLGELLDAGQGWLEAPALPETQARVLASVARSDAPIPPSPEEAKQFEAALAADGAYLQSGLRTGAAPRRAADSAPASATESAPARPSTSAPIPASPPRALPAGPPEDPAPTPSASVSAPGPSGPSAAVGALARSAPAFSQTSEVSETQRETLDLLLSGFTDSFEGIHEVVQAIDAAGDLRAEMVDPEVVSEVFEPLTDACEAAGLPSLAAPVRHLYANATAVLEGRAIPTRGLSQATEPVLSRLIDWLKQPARAEAEAVLAAWAEPDWPVPLEAPSLEAFAVTLAEELGEMMDAPSEEPQPNPAALEPAAEQAGASRGTSPTDASPADAPPHAAAAEPAKPVPTVAVPTPALSERPEPSETVREVLGLLAAGFADSAPALQDHVRAVESGDPAAGGATNPVDEIVQPLVEACEAAGLPVLGEPLGHIATQLANRAESSGSGGDSGLAGRVEGLLDRIQDWLQRPGAREAEAVLAQWADAGWPTPAEPQALTDFAARLPTELAQLDAEAAAEQALPDQVELADLAVTPGADAEATVVASFRREAPRIAASLAEAVQAMAAGRADTEQIRQAQRDAHTLKGSAAISGISGVAWLTHRLEDLLEHLADRGALPPEGLREALLQGTDTVAMMVDTVTGIEPQSAEAFRPGAQAVLDWARRLAEGEDLSQAGDAAPVAAESPTPSPEPIATSNETPTPPAPEATAATGEAATPAEPASSEAPDVTVARTTLDQMVQLVGELTIALGQLEQRLGASRGDLNRLLEQNRLNLQRITALEELTDLRGLGTQVAQRLAGTPEPAAGDIPDLEQYNELYVTTRRLNEGISDARELTQRLNESMQTLEELHNQNQELGRALRDTTLATRLVPVDQGVSRLQRAVRQTARSTGKSARLEITGAELLIDNDVLEYLVPALLHVVRNAIDHGIEAPEARAAAGKPAEGRLQLVFQRHGNTAAVVFTDDGRGLDYPAIQRKAQGLGWIEPGGSPTRAELARLTLRPGFSTRQAVSAISGRGVGMDTVDDAVRRLRGDLRIESEPGEGYRLELRFPINLLSLHALLVRCGDALYALPGADLERIVPPGEGEWPSPEQIQLDEETVPVRHLNRLVGQPVPEAGPETQPMLLVRAEGVARGILVEWVEDSRDIVIKRLGRYVPESPGVTGAAILGSGAVAPILDPRTLLRLADTDDLPERVATAAVPGARRRAPSVLIVDDSLSVRRSLSQLVTDAGLEARTAADGMDAIRQVDQACPAVLLVDLEMPQMNGLELAGHLRGRADTAGIPIGMITSRATDRFRSLAQQAGIDRYFVKPYAEDEVIAFLEEAIAVSVSATG
jgi:chemosensory pili system protein ChpA (sensor histidine kinase/response regulator)